MKKNRIVALTLSLLLLVVSTSVFVQAAESEDVESVEAESAEAESEEAEEPRLRSALEVYQFLQEMFSEGSLSFQLNEKATTFLSEHDDLFPCDSSEDIDSELIDETILPKQIRKSSEKFGDKLMSLNPLYVVEIEEVGEGDEVFLTVINAIADDSEQYYIYYYGELPDIYEEDSINVIGLPLGNSYFDNLTGGQTEVIILAGSYVELAEEE